MEDNQTENTDFEPAAEPHAESPQVELDPDKLAKFQA